VGPRRADAANGEDRSMAATRWTEAIIVLGNRQRGLDARWEEPPAPSTTERRTSDASVGAAVPLGTCVLPRVGCLRIGFHPSTDVQNRGLLVNGHLALVAADALLRCRVPRHPIRVVPICVHRRSPPLGPCGPPTLGTALACSWCRPQCRHGVSPDLQRADLPKGELP
jgi:hypothetical protein